MPPWTAHSTAYTCAPRPDPSAPTKPHADSLPDPDSHLALPTPPPSLPASTPGSPEAPFTSLSTLEPVNPARPPLADLDMPAPAPSPAGPRRRKKRADPYQLAHGLADLDEGPPSIYSDPAVPFPTASDEPPRSAAAGPSSFKSREGTPGRSDSRKRASHPTMTTSTTTATRKTERRQVRYSFPGLDHLVAPGPHAGPHRPRSPSTGSSRARSPSGTSRKASAPLAPRSTRRSSSKHDPHSSAPKPQQPPHHQQQQQRWRSSSYSTPATSSPFFRRSSSASSYAIQRRQSTLGGDHGALLPAGSAPFLRPLVNAFAFFVVSAVAALTISAVLATSFSLTFYDDCSRRVGHVQRSLGGSIEGVRAGMGRMIGNARGALDLAVRAAGGTTAIGGGGPSAYSRMPAAAHSPSAVDAESAERRRTTIPTVPQAQEPELETDDIAAGGARIRSKRTRTSSAQADSPAAPAPASPSPSKRRRPFFRPSPPSFTPSSSPPASMPREVAEPGSTDHSGTATPGWRTDDDDGASLPFQVPPSTPRSSRAASPLRTGPSPRALPPRPPLAVLIPSVVFALLFTLCKVLFQAWKGRSCGSERRSYSSSRARC
ncbi:hypothetical protein JCM9279_007407 [Rhodotorula babjevae]